MELEGRTAEQDVIAEVTLKFEDAYHDAYGGDNRASSVHEGTSAAEEEEAGLPSDEE